MVKKMRNWAIVGKGFIYPRHKKAIEEIGDKVFVTCDKNTERDAHFQSWENLLNSSLWPFVDYVSICTPNDLHIPMAIEAIKTGKKVLCEKPLGLSSKDIETLPYSVNTVLQLRHHPAVIKLKENTPDTKQIDLVVKVKRDPEYWESWKGQKERSGGILFNLGIHYFDLLIHLFGENCFVKNAEVSDKLATGKIMWKDRECLFHIEIMPDDAEQDRFLAFDGKEISLSKQDNLSFEDLHVEVFKEFKNGLGIRPDEAIKSVKLIEEICKVAKGA